MENTTTKNETSLKKSKQSICMFNVAYKKYKRKFVYPWSLKIQIGLDKDLCFDNGLPTKEYKFSTAVIKQDLLKELFLNFSSSVHYLGYIYRDYKLELFLYTKEPIALNHFLQSKIKKFDIGMSYEFRRDVKWNLVKEYFERTVKFINRANKVLSLPWYHRFLSERVIF